MDNIFRGESISKESFISKIVSLKEIIEHDLLLEQLKFDIVIEALDRLSREIDLDEIKEEINQLGLPKWAVSDYINDFISNLSKRELYQKLYKELGESPFEWKKINDQIEEKHYPLGVLMHIGAGNALGLSAFSVIEGLLTGNINILKLPENEGNISSRILLKLIEIEPRLKPYIYVLDISSKNQEVISKLIEVVNGVIIWGSNAAIQSIRQITPPTVQIIEWGHRISFAYFTKHDQFESDLIGLAKDIVMTDQLYCSSPQCVFYETKNQLELDNFALILAKHLELLGNEYPSLNRPFDIQSHITWTHELVKMEEILNKKKIITDQQKSYSVIIDYEAKLIPSPLYRNIWVMPVDRNMIYNLIRKHKGHLQTVGLSCHLNDLEHLSGFFYTAGVNRIMRCGEMSSNYSGEPHDGVYALQRYIRIVNRRLID